MKKYNGWLDILGLNSISGLPIHRIDAEVPPQDEVIIPILFSPGDEPLGDTPLSEWPWEDPLLLVGEPILGKELDAVTEDGIVLWWLTQLEIVEAIEKTVTREHCAYFAQSIAMQVLEQKLEAKRNGNQL